MAHSPAYLKDHTWNKYFHIDIADYLNSYRRWVWSMKVVKRSRNTDTHIYIYVCVNYTTLLDGLGNLSLNCHQAIGYWSSHSVLHFNAIFKIWFWFALLRNWGLLHRFVGISIAFEIWWSTVENGTYFLSESLFNCITFTTPQTGSSFVPLVFGNVFVVALIFIQTTF